MASSETAVKGSLRLLAKSSAIVLLGVVLSKLFSYLYKVVIARSFGPETYGLFSLAFIIVGLVITLASLGLVEGLVRFVTLYRKKNPSFIAPLTRWASRIVGGTALLLAVLLFWGAPQLAELFHTPALTLYLRVMACTLPFMALANLSLSFVRAHERISQYSFVTNIVQNGARVFFLGLLLLIGVKTNAVLISYTAGAIMFYLCARSIARGITLIRTNEQNEQGLSSLKRALWHYSLPIIFVGVIGNLFYWVDSLVIGYYLTVSQVGFYNAAFTIASLFGLASEMFMQLFFPLIVREYAQKNYTLIREISKQVSKWIFIINVPLFILAFCFPGALLNALFGEAYLSSAGALRILAFGCLFSSLFMALGGNLLSMQGKTRWLLGNTLLVSVINLLLNIYLVPRYGLEGAAWGTVLSWLVLCGLLLYEIHKTLGFVPIRRTFLSVVVVSLIPTALLFFARERIPLTLVPLMSVIGLFFLVYLCLVILGGCLDRYDRDVLETLERKLPFLRRFIPRVTYKILPL